jgi:predicted GIY-YIG superfamily endonuclease
VTKSEIIQHLKHRFPNHVGHGWLYLSECRDGALYTGIALDVDIGMK